MLDAIVIGAGVGGLSAAISLASAGMRVRLYESAAEAGGKAGISCVDGVEIDTGPSVLTMPFVFEELLALAGTSLAEEAPLMRPEPFFRYLWPDGTSLDVHGDYADTRRSVARTLGESTATELDAFLEHAAGIWSVARPRFVLGDAPRLADLVRLGLSGLREASRLDGLSTMWRAIDRRVTSPHLKMMLARYATYNGSDPRKAPATLNCIAHVELVQGAYSVRGGTYVLVRALQRAAERLGVELVMGEPVAGIVLAGSRVTGVVLGSGAEASAPIVVANADVSHVMHQLLPATRAEPLDGGSEPSLSGHCFVVRARRGQARAAHTVLFPDDYLQEFVDLFDRGRSPRCPTVYVCAQEQGNERRGWPEDEPLFVMVNAPAEPERGRSAPRAWLELEAVAVARLRDAGLVRAEDPVVWRRNPGDLARRFAGSRGAIYGAASHSWNAAFKRPANLVPGVPGLYLASGSAHPGGGLPLAALSGRAAARSALERVTDPPSS